MAVSSTNMSDSSAPSLMPRSASTRSARATKRARSTGRSDCSLAAKTWAVTAAAGEAELGGQPMARSRGFHCRRQGSRCPRQLRRLAGANDPGTDAAGLGGAVVRGDDLAHDAVAYDITLSELDKGDPFDLAEQFLELQQPGTAACDVDLGHVTGHDHLLCQSRCASEHLHLFRGRVLSFIEDHEASVECAASHEGKRGTSIAPRSSSRWVPSGSSMS